MEPDDFIEPGTEAADRRDNRTAIIVAVCAAIVVGIAAGILMATSGGSHESTPSPTQSSVSVESAAIPGLTE